MQITFNDLLNFGEDIADNIKIRFNQSNSIENPLDLYQKNPDIVNNQWLLWRSKKRYFQEGQIAISFLKLTNDTWLLTTIKKITKDLDIENGISYEGVELEDYVFCGPSMVFTNDLTPRAKYPKGSAGYKKTVLHTGATVGANATVVCGHELGKWSMIAAGAVVTKNVKDHALMAGVPARQIGWVCECGEILYKSLVCDKCGRAYEEKETGLVEK